MLLLTIILEFYCFAQIFGQMNNCHSKDTCGECIQEIDCVWCTNPKSENHCIHQKDSTSEWCDPSSTVNPTINFETLENRPFSSEKAGTVQIKPQRVKLSLRKGQEFKLKFQYTQAENYPVDLYYVMDLSASMIEHKDKLAKLGSLLAQTMRNITNNFQLGFGSFVDKVDLPFVSTVPAKLKSPCRLSRSGKVIVCVAPYSFKNHLSLNSDYNAFSTKVEEAQISGNLDAPEGGFDAIMQAIVCKKEIGWRPQARHLLVFSTDAEFHIAGDGKLAGVVEPNDAKCHLENNKYTADLIYDYPSVSHINYVAKENNINIIFAIVKKNDLDKSYSSLSQMIENSNMGILDQDSKNVVQLVLDNYNKIVDSVTISSNASNDVEIKITSTCAKSKENGCTNIHVGEIVNFTATIKPLQCTSGRNNKIISIKPETLEESILVELEVVCDCTDCEASSQPNSPKCSKSGKLKCGVCECNEGFFGRKCECDKQNSVSEDVSNCKANANDQKICSGLGTCKCGKCECNKRQRPEERIFGKHCECDNYSCKRVDGVLCSKRGSCGCGGVCNCLSGWAGDACECPDTNSTCIKLGDDSICSGHGTCNCGRCECFTEGTRYSGKYCDECPTCAAQRCEELRHCVECQTYNTGKYGKDQCQLTCTSFTTIQIDEIDKNGDDDVKICTMVDKNDCTFVFQYEYGMNKELIVKAEKKKSCSEPAPVLAWVFGVIGSIILAGLLLLIMWKVLTTIHDRREYARFENERQNMKWHRSDNPLYRQATSTFNNPVYGHGRQSKRFSLRK